MPYRLLEEGFSSTAQPKALSSHQHGRHMSFPEHTVVGWQLSRHGPVITKLALSSLE